MISTRNRELLNLVVVAILIGIGFTSVYVAQKAVFDSKSLSYGVFFLAVFIAAHLVNRFTVPWADPYLLPMAGLLAALGFTEIYRLDQHDAGRQGLWIVLGVLVYGVTLITLRRDYRVLESYKYLFGLGAILLLVLPAVPGIGATVNGARLWVRIGSFQFQPGELAKIFLIVFLAGYLREKREVLAQGRLKDFGPLLVIWGGAMLVLVQTNDLGSALLYFGVFLAMVYAATGRALYAAIGAVLFVGGAAAAYTMIPRIQDRVAIWLDPWSRAQDEGYQPVQATYSIAEGGFGGTGLGKGSFTLPGGADIIPELNTDFIFAALAQELGLIGISGLILVYMLFTLRGFRIALLAAGLTFVFALQTFIIVGGVLRVIPLTGITLPFVSYGGSSVVSNFVMLALLLLVSHRAVRTAPT